MPESVALLLHLRPFTVLLLSCIFCCGEGSSTFLFFCFFLIFWGLGLDISTVKWVAGGGRGGGVRDELSTAFPMLPPLGCTP